MKTTKVRVNNLLKSPLAQTLDFKWVPPDLRNYQIRLSRYIGLEFLFFSLDYVPNLKLLTIDNFARMQTAQIKTGLTQLESHCWDYNISELLFHLQLNIKLFYGDDVTLTHS